MSRLPAAMRTPLAWLALAALLSGCQSLPGAHASVSSKSSLLAVDVRFPSPLRRDHSLVQVFFVRGPIHAGLAQLPELVPATFVVRSRAYLLDPEPGTYSLVAVTSKLAPLLTDLPVAGGVTRTVVNEELGHVAILPAALIGRTRTAIRPGDVAFMGDLRLRRSERIDADAVYHDELEPRIAERIRPGVTTQSGAAAWFSITWMVDLDATSLSNAAADREAFLAAARTDLGDSPWAAVIARAAPGAATAASSWTPAPEPQRAGPSAEPADAQPHAAVPGGKPATSDRDAAIQDTAPALTERQAAIPSAAPATAEPQAAIPDAAPATPQPQTATPDAAPEPPATAPPQPKRRVVAGLPPGSPLAKIELGMHHGEVREILGDPDEKLDRLTAKAWIPFYDGPGARLIEWVYSGVGRVVFSQHTGRLLVVDVVPETGAPR